MEYLWSASGRKKAGNRNTGEIVESAIGLFPALPDPDLKNGKTVIYGRILGYDPTHGIALKFNCTDWLFFDVFGQSVPVVEDGSFRYETNMMLPGEATLRVGRKRFELFLMPAVNLR